MTKLTKSDKAVMLRIVLERVLYGESADWLDMTEGMKPRPSMARVYEDDRNDAMDVLAIEIEKLVADRLETL